ncbi:MacS family sensor histidine kinase [Kibdelosporangium philippinense]|uniref:MacS family sensor histidine kinase n=1 Tax=Kibdelosporangium philippinense TaxID=211113 RepID=UPI0027DFFBFB|nr:ATP-binding protein [Kibdelosporangium philippinense]
MLVQKSDVATPMWSSVAILRLVTFGFAVAAVFVHHNNYAEPELAWAVLGLIAVWTAFTVTAYLMKFGRRVAVVWTDVAVTCALMYTSVWILSPEQNEAIVPLITTVWASEPPIAAAVLNGRTAGVLAGIVVAIATGFSRGALTTDVTRDAVLLMGSGFVVGLASVMARRAQERMAQAARAEAATAERERLARSIHDSVLQVLARVRKRGNELGGEAAELGVLAGEQEVALRSLVAAAPPESSADGTADLGPRLQVLATGSVQVSVPGTPVQLPSSIVTELTSLVSEALLNVVKHAGDGANAWVLLEDLGDEVVISVRDDGAGIPAGRLDQAASDGRMGVARSIRGRVADLGGTITLETAPGEGTEWEIRIPREPVGKGRHRVGGVR